MPKDEAMETRIAVLESKVDNLIGIVAKLQQEMATRSDVENLQRQIDLLQRQIDGLQRQLEVMRGEIARSISEAGARFDQRLTSSIKALATKAEVRKALLTCALGIITVQTAINAAMITAVVQFLR